MKKDITELYCCVEDFCRMVDENFANILLPNGRKPTRIPGITIPEILTVILLYHQSPCKNFKAFYLLYLPLYRSEFPKLPTYDPGLLFLSREFMVFRIAFAMVLRTSKNDRYFLHRHFFNRRLPFKKNLKKQSFQWISEAWKDYIWLVFRLQIALGH